MEQSKKQRGKALLRKIYQNNSIKMQFALVYSLFVLAPTLVALLLMSHTANKKLQDATLQTAEDMVAQISSNVSFQFQQMVNISLTISTNGRVREILSSRNTDIYTDYCDTQEVQKIIDEIIIISQGLEAKLYVDSEKSYSGQGVYFHDIRRFYENHDVAGRGYLDPQVSWSCQVEDGAPATISFITPVYSYHNITQAIAFLEMDMKYANIGKLITGSSLADSSDYFIVDNSGGVLYTSADGADQAFDLEDFRYKQGVFQRAGAYYAYAQVSPSQWYIVYRVNIGALSMDTTYSFFTTSVLIVTLVAGFYLVAVLCLVLIVTHHYDRKIQAITDSLDAYDVSELEPNLKRRVNNLDFLTANVNRLMLKVKDMTEQAAQTEVNEKKAQLKALQFQISPHFLYNALDTINWAAIKRGDMEASKQVGLLARYFRLVLSNGDMNIPISEELEFCRVYLQLQDGINPGKFTFEIDDSGLARDVVLPKMTIHPIVENALIHGVLKQRSRKGEIRILVEQTDTLTRVKVRDNGTGFAVDRLQASIRQGGKDGFGLHNIYERLKLFLGNDPRVDFQSDENGTQVEITLDL